MTRFHRCLPSSRLDYKASAALPLSRLLRSETEHFHGLVHADDAFVRNCLADPKAIRRCAPTRAPTAGRPKSKRSEAIGERPSLA
jgi:hypothetical protein